MYNPTGTYRIQFHKEFTFREFEQVIQYLSQLGVSTFYAAPIFTATPGSNHGYDALDPHSINPEIGTLEELRQISRNLKAAGMGWLQDIVPNHMAFDPRNPWLWDVLQKGRASAYAKFFDINWDAPHHDGKLMVPFLGSSLEETIEKGELQLVTDGGRPCLQYFDTRYPCNAETCSVILENAGITSDDVTEDCFQKLESANEALNEVVRQLNADKTKLLQLATSQHYRLCHWKETDQRINYRRFFTVNGLICLNIQDEEVFTTFHRFVNELTQEGIFNGLRIDHIDGLFDPGQYLQRLRSVTGDQVYLTVEKILQPDEDLPANWQTEGTTGYDFLATVNNLFTSREHEASFRQFYTDIAPTYSSFDQQLRDKKSYILFHHMNGELDNLLQLLYSLELLSADQLQDSTPEMLRLAIGSFLVHCPVYRYYASGLPLPPDEAAAIARILRRMRETEPEIAPAVGLLESVFLQQETNPYVLDKAAYFYQRCMQFSGPLMAKGFEDTLMYTYQLFLAHSEVGDSSDAFGLTTEDFHKAMAKRQKAWPLSINTTSTHDTKRGEDVRARLNVLSELGPAWLLQVEAWLEQHAALKQSDGPHINDIYFIYQAIVGHYPMTGEPDEDFESRLEAYLQKALREAKLHTNWSEPNEVYEKATIDFAKNILRNTDFREDLRKFLPRVMDHGIVNSLTQLILKFTSPGIPDVYQGTELWDLSFVDPDNRRPVDYNTRAQLLEAVSQLDPAEAFAALWKERYTGKIKLWLTQQLFQLRRQYPSLLSEGEYVPLEVKGKHRLHVIAFARRHRRSLIIVVAPLFTATLAGEKDLLEIDWEDTRVQLPQDVLPTGELLLTGGKINMVEALPLKEIFSAQPFAMIRADVLPNKRSAGVLMHISSLPSAFGIGDMGPEAKRFADFLFRSYQKYWQLLPLNPTEGGQGHSPYSSTSSKAGNILLISPELLAEEGLLAAESLSSLPQEGKTDYEAATALKQELLKLAWENFLKNGKPALTIEFEIFCDKEKSWLDDFALYMLLKSQHQGKPWYEWPDVYKFRSVESIKELRDAHADQLQHIRWMQFVFAKQWHQLKTYCNQKGIELIGDIPFYVSYDSADVWAAPELFKLDEKGARRGVAGVPPDAFSADGQLWGMPVFRWNAMKRTGYSWWIERLRKNIELFDVVRLDHFRAFSAYWEVPAKEDTARNGKWIKGPGAHFFSVMKKTFGELPFIAEDLGEIDEPVYRLRDQFHMPGMKVLQFAFGEDMGSTPHAPHNYKENFIVYTGTHDNNTTRGWWRQEGAAARPFLEKYVGRQLSEDEVPDLLARLAYGSVARVVILPLQDVLGLDEIARMNLPSAPDGNWQWRLLPGQLTDAAEKKLKFLTKTYNRR